MTTVHDIEQALRGVVDPDRLVEWNVADGWAPLCGALGLDVPDEPFPRTNDRADLAGRVTDAVAGRVERRV